MLRLSEEDLEDEVLRTPPDGEWTDPGRMEPQPKPPLLPLRVEDLASTPRSRSWSPLPPSSWESLSSVCFITVSRLERYLGKNKISPCVLWFVKWHLTFNSSEWLLLGGEQLTGSWSLSRCWFSRLGSLGPNQWRWFLKKSPSPGEPGWSWQARKWKREILYMRSGKEEDICTLSFLVEDTCLLFGRTIFGNFSLS